MRSHLTTAIEAGASYFSIVFSASVILGTVRVLYLIPALGPWAGLLLELAIMLAFSWYICRWLIAHLEVLGGARDRLTMGGIAFVLLLAAELVLSIALLDRPIAETLQAIATPQGAWGLLAQIAFATWPLLQVQRGRSASTLEIRQSD